MGKWKPLLKKLWGSVIIFAAFVLVLMLCANILRRILWENTNEMGLSLVKSCSSAEEQAVKTCEAVLHICADHIMSCEKDGVPPAEIRSGLYPLINGLTGLYGEGQIRVYGGVRGGGLVSSDPALEGAEDCDVTEQPWYRGAAEANGGSYLSPLYIDEAAGLPVVTLCRLLPETGSFLAVDIRPSAFTAAGQELELPEQAAYCLVDQEGAPTGSSEMCTSTTWTTAGRGSWPFRGRATTPAPACFAASAFC